MNGNIAHVKNRMTLTTSWRLQFRLHRLCPRSCLIADVLIVVVGALTPGGPRHYCKGDRKGALLAARAKP